MWNMHTQTDMQMLCKYYKYIQVHMYTHKVHMHIVEAVLSIRLAFHTWP